MENYHPIMKFVVEGGVPIQTAVLLLMLPIVATLVAFFRQVVGIKAFGIYTPSIVTFALIAFDPNGLKYGILIFGSVIFVGMITRFVLRRFRLLYLPRVAITLSVISFSILSLLVFGSYFQRTGLASAPIFPILIMITISEKFVAVQIEKGTKMALVLAAETLGISLIGYALLSWADFIRLLELYPWTVLLTIPLNVLLGKWTGLRLSEYVRFARIIRQK
ncbi:MAG: 7TM domain-containing protein [Candidatus Moraniibacteriota bacterium]